MPTCAGPTGWWEHSAEEQRHLPALLSPEPAVPTPSFPALTRKLVNLVPPSMSLVLFQLLFLCWSLGGVSEWMSLAQAFEEDTWVYNNPLSHPGWVPVDFHSQAGEHGVGLGPLSPQEEPLQLRDPSHFLTATDRCGTYPIHISASPTSLIMASSLYPSYRTSIQLASRWFSVMVSL